MTSKKGNFNIQIKLRTPVIINNNPHDIHKYIFYDGH